MLFPRLFYFVFFGAMASLGPYLASYYQENGLSGGQIGFLTALPALMTLVCAPVWTGLADVTRRHKLILLTALTGLLGSIVAILWAPSFPSLVAAVGSYALFIAPITSMVDNAVLQMLGPNKNTFGRQRVLGSLGPGVVGPLVSTWIDRIGLRAIFYSAIVFLTLALGVASQFSFEQEQDGDGDSEPVSPGAFWSDLLKLLVNRDLLLLLFVIFVGMMGRSAGFTYLFVHMGNLGASNTLMGLSLTVLTIGELPFLLYSNRFLKRWGIRNTLIVALVASGAMLLTFAWMRAPWIGVAVHLLHGISYSGMWLAGVDFADKVAPSGLKTTAQGVFNAIAVGLAPACGAYLGGIVFDKLGAEVFFQGLGFAALAALGVFWWTTARSNSM